jgi:hypothetical protein
MTFRSKQVSKPPEKLTQERLQLPLLIKVMSGCSALLECLKLLRPRDHDADTATAARDESEKGFESPAWSGAIAFLKAARKQCVQPEAVATLCATSAPANTVEILALLLHKGLTQHAVAAQVVKVGFQFLANLSVSPPGAALLWQCAFPRHFTTWLAPEHVDLIQFPSMMLYNCLRHDSALCMALTEAENIWLPITLLDRCSHVAASAPAEGDGHDAIELDFVYLTFELLAQVCLEPLYHGLHSTQRMADSRKVALLHVLAGQSSASGPTFVLPPKSQRFLCERFQMLAFVVSDVARRRESLVGNGVR